MFTRRNLLASTAAALAASPAVQRPSEARATRITRRSTVAELHGEDASRRDPELLDLIRGFEAAEREEDRLDTLASADPDNDRLSREAKAADRRRLEAADALCRALRAREVADPDCREFAVRYRGRIYYASLARMGSDHLPPVHRLGIKEPIQLAEN
jgi:hypothetical protein